jgi:hypothetical protein
MPEESKPNDAGAVWRDQPEEKLAVNMQEFMCRRTRELHSGTRLEIFMSIASALVLLVIFAWRFALAQDTVQQLGMAAVTVWVLISVYRFSDRLRDGPPTHDALATTGLEYYRKELERRRDHLRNSWVWYGPLFLACLILATVVARTTLPSVARWRTALPVIALLVVWVGFDFDRRRRQANELQEEIDEVPVLDGPLRGE